MDDAGVTPTAEGDAGVAPTEDLHMASKRSRRQFLQHGLAAGGAIVAAGYWSERAAAKSKSPNELLNIGVIGSGGRGRADLDGVSTENIVALCDVDQRNLNHA